MSQVASSALGQMLRTDDDSYPLYDSQISQQLNDSKVALGLTTLSLSVLTTSLNT